MLKATAVLSLAGIIFLSFFSFYSCDDYCNKIELARYPVLNFAWLQYMNWDGRSISLPAFVQFFSLKFLSPGAAAFIWATSFAGTGFLVYCILVKEKSLVLPDFHPLISVALITSLLWVGMWKLVPDIIYWPTGGSYSMLNLLGLAWWLYFIHGIGLKEHSLVKYMVAFLFSLVAGINSHNLVIPMLFLCLLETVYQIKTDGSKNKLPFFICAFTGLLLGASIVFLAPGNGVRLSVTSYTGFDKHIFFNFFLVLAKYIYWLLLLIISGFSFALLSGKKFRLTLWKAGSVSPGIILTRVYQNKYLAAAILTLVVFISIPRFAVPRTGIFFGTFIFMHIVAGKSVLSKNQVKRFKLITTGFFVCFIALIGIQMWNASKIRKVLREREVVFATMTGKDVFVEPIAPSSIPFAFQFTDLSGDSSFWSNRCIATYYHLNSVRTGFKQTSDSGEK